MGYDWLPNLCAESSDVSERSVTGRYRGQIQRGGGPYCCQCYEVEEGLPRTRVVKWKR